MIEGLGEWGQRWARTQVSAHDLDPVLPMWDIHRRLNTDRLPDRRVVVRFDFRGVPKTVRCPTTFWLILEHPRRGHVPEGPGLRGRPHGDADLAACTKVWMDDVPLATATPRGARRA